MIEPEDEGSGESDGRQEAVSASIIARVDTSPVLEASEHVFDAMALPIEGAIVGYGDLAIAFRRDAGGDAPRGERVAEPVGVVSPVCEHGCGGRQGIDQQGSALIVTGLSFGQHEAEGPAATIADRVELGGQPAATTSDTAG